MVENAILLAAVSLLSACQQIYFALHVGKTRLQCKITAPAVTGSPQFERIFRAHFCSWPGSSVPIWPSQVLLGIFRSC
uniref:Microsomal glutathione S-transferase 2 isoform X3 n=1 Tax=Castor canadensis TaxID=51338 RepID=A0A8C0W4H4_CASCN|nr:microsomal glutathione S-transferase 2 isoform X3 [Castor canadensis]